MRILTPNNTLAVISKVTPFAEERVAFNGSEVRLCQRVRDIKNMSGLFLNVAQNGFSMINQGDILLGNLKFEKAEEIMQKLLTEGYYDLSELEFQKSAGENRLPMFDGGKTLPYYIDDSMMVARCSPIRESEEVGSNMMFPMGTGAMAQENVFGTDEPEDPEDEDFDIESIGAHDVFSMEERSGKEIL